MLSNFRPHSPIRGSRFALTLVELMLAFAILVFVLAGIMATYITCLDLINISRNTSIAINIAQAKLEEIKNTNFAQIKNNYNNVAFDVIGLTGKGVSYGFYCNGPSDCNDTYAPTNLLEVIVSVGWRQNNGRLIGEDLNLNGVLNAGEDNNANGILDSPAEVVTYIAEP